MYGTDSPPSDLGQHNVLNGILGRLLFQIKLVKALLTSLRNQAGILIGRVWKRYSRHWKAVIFIALHLPIHDNLPCDHFLKSVPRDASMGGGKLTVKNFPRSSGSLMSRCIIRSCVHRKGKLSLTSSTILQGRVIFRASDFCKCIFRFEMLPNVSSVFNRLGREICGCEMKRRLSAYAATFCSANPGICTSLMVGSALIYLRKGSIVSANSSGDKGQPCLVPLAIISGSDNKLLTLTHAVGRKYIEPIQVFVLSPSSIFFFLKYFY